MTVRKIYSDTRLIDLLKPKDEEINNLLPKFLLKDLRENSSINFSDDEIDNLSFSEVKVN